MPASAYATAFLQRLTDAYESHRDEARAVAMAAYMRDQFPFLGIPTPARARLDRQAAQGLGPPAEPELIAVAHACWRRPEREYQYAACALLRRHVRRCSAGFLPTAERLLTAKSWWDTVDDLAQNVVGPLVGAHPQLTATMDRWIGHENAWLVRAAILHQQRYKGQTDVERLLRYCLARADDHRFFVRKAIGWALREYSKTDADAVIGFVREHEHELSGLSKTEALKWLARRGPG
jgi:3-methyladenine DNA glycosylase AlkD